MAQIEVYPGQWRDLHHFSNFSLYKELDNGNELYLDTYPNRLDAVNRADELSQSGLLPYFVKNSNTGNIEYHTWEPENTDINF